MTLVVQAPKGAMAAPVAGGREYQWEDLMMELWPLISSPLTPEAERLLLDVVHFDGRLRLVVSCDMPHSMPPEEMLKSLAVQALARWTGLDYLHEMLKVQMTTPSSSLASLIGDVIQKTRDSLTPASKREVVKEDAEEVAETSPQEAMKTVRRPLAKERGMSYLPGFRRRTYGSEREPAMAG